MRKPNRVAGFTLLLAACLHGPAEARTSREAKPAEQMLNRPVTAPVMAVISLGEQRISIYDAEGRVARAPVSSGKSGYETPAGIYSVIQKEVEHYSNLYDDAEMPFMQRITWSGIALHAGQLPGYPASHGCIRLPHAFAERLYSLTKLGTRVIVARNDVAPAPISHPALFRPKPVEGPAVLAAQPAGLSAMSAGNPPSTETKTVPHTLRSIAAAKAAEAEAAARKAEEARLNAMRKTGEAARATKMLRRAEGARLRAEAQLKAAEAAIETASSPEAVQQAEDLKAKASARLAEAQSQADEVKATVDPKREAAARAVGDAQVAEAARLDARDAAREAARKASPMSVFISRQTQRLYVRQSFEPVLEVPVTIQNADKPIGTHVYTAVAQAGDDVRWNVVSMVGARSRDERDSRARRSRDQDAEVVGGSADAAEAALERVSIPQEAIDRVSETIGPGSTLIISDEELSGETSKGTDFIVVMSGEPQGGIKIRRRNPEARYRDDRRYLYRRAPYAGSSFSWW